MIVCEGRDDTARLREALDCDTIETHGFGITKETWAELEIAYKERGLIILTDPDHAGSEIRKRLKEKFPESKEAFIPRKKASSAGDIGVENASPEAVREALMKVRGSVQEESMEKREEISMADMEEAGLTGKPMSGKLREKLADALGIGYGNAKAMLKKMNALGITPGEFRNALRAVRDKEAEE